ncbi:MAG: BTAD domain-containing putative transcriptional regulator [Candidatus Sericytochromatia bacterium]|nr:BTAD domain-containing putative transcriptional regulator [Candidatus Sericytochromatia bacterium]
MSTGPLPRKITLPRLPSPHVARPALHARLRDGLSPERCLTVVIGGPGYGKSTLAAAYARESGLPCGWYGLDETDGDLGTFLSTLVAALRVDLPDLGGRATELVRSSSNLDAATATVVGLLAEELAVRAEDGGVLVLDDVHHVGHSAAIQEALRLLVRDIPDQWQLLLTSRESPPLPLGPLRVKRQLVELGQRELRFQAAEGQELLAAFSGLTLSPTESLALAHQTDGWVASLILAAQAVAHAGSEGASLLFRELDHPTAWHDYLAEEILHKQAPENQAFMLQTALLPHVEAAVCREGLGFADAADHIRRLRAQQLLVPLSPGEAGGAELDTLGQVFHYQPSFRRFLRSRLSEVLTPEALARLARRAGAHLAQAQPDLALELLLQAGALEEAEQILVDVSGALLEKNQLDRLKGLLTRFPPDFRARSAALSFLHGEVLRQWGEYDQAMACFELAEQLGGESPWAARALVHQAAIHLGRQDPRAEQVLSLGASALNLADLPSRAFCANLQGALAFSNHDLGRAITEYQHALSLYRQLEDPVGQAKALVNLGLCYTRSGQFAEGLASCREAVVQSERAGRMPPPMTHNNIAAILTYEGHFEEAWRAAERALDLARLLRSRRDILYAEVALGAAALGLGDVRRADGHFEAARDGALALQDRLTAAKAYAARAEVALYLDQHARAQGLLDQGIELMSLGLSEAPMLDLAIQQLELWLAAGQPEAIGPLLPTVRAHCERLGYRYRQAQVAYYHARWLQGLERTEEASAAWQEADRLADALGFLHLKEHESRHRGSISSQPRGQSLAPKPAGEIAPLIRIETFGEMSVSLQGEVVPAKAWRGFKTKLILAFLLAHPDGVSKESLTELLYGDQDTSRTAVLVLLSRLRYALEPDLGRHAVSRFIQFADGRYAFNRALPAQVDTQDFLYHLQRGQDITRSQAERTDELKAAIALYRGAYLADLETDSPWLTIERERYRRLNQDAFSSLLQLYRQAGEESSALQTVEANLAFDPCCESAHQTKLLLLARAGQREQALRHYQVMCQVFQRELGLQPSRETQALHQAIARGEAIAAFPG